MPPLRWIVVAALFLISNCAKQQTVSIETPLFIQFPTNTHVFDNIGPVLYEAVHQQLQQTGFSLTDTPQHAYQLAITLKALDPSQKNISPDIVLQSYNVRLSFNLKVLNYARLEVFNYNDTCSILISKPRNPMLNDAYIFDAYQVLAKRAARIIQQQLTLNSKRIFGPSP